MISNDRSKDNFRQLILIVNVCSERQWPNSTQSYKQILQLFTLLQHFWHWNRAFSDCIYCVFPIHYERKKKQTFLIRIENRRPKKYRRQLAIVLIKCDQMPKIKLKRGRKNKRLCTLYGRCDRHFALASKHIYCVWFFVLLFFLLVSLCIGIHNPRLAYYFYFLFSLVFTLTPFIFFVWVCEPTGSSSYLFI